MKITHELNRDEVEEMIINSYQGQGLEPNVLINNDGSATVVFEVPFDEYIL